jgi:hypothetical protein
MILTTSLNKKSAKVFSQMTSLRKFKAKTVFEPPRTISTLGWHNATFEVR